LHVDDPVAGEDPLVGDRAHALLDRGDEHAVDVVADERLGEDDTAVARPGAIRIHTSANWPAPPVCFLWR
jgi:hypothetical protein